MHAHRALRALTFGAVLALGGAVPFCGPSGATTVAAEYANQDACGNAYLGNADNNAQDFVNWMQAFGYARRFVYGNSLFWPDDLVSSTVSGGKDNLYGDTTNILFLESHGGSDAAKFRITTGATRTIDGYSTCRSYTEHPTTGNQWWQLGDGDLRVLCLLSCHSLELTDLAHYDGVARGIHMITGGDGNMYDSNGSGFGVAFWGCLGLTIKQAWFGNTSADTWVVMAYGTTSSEAASRRDGERFSSSMVRETSTQWRAWSWVH
jgi:hypothetical protein